MTGRQIGALIDAHAAALVLFARQWCATPEDAAQAAFARLAAQTPPPDDPVAWLFRVTKNAALDAGRAERRRRRREKAVARPVRWFNEDAADGLDAAAAVRALDDLRAEQREIIVARLWGGVTLEQAAAVAGCSVSTAHRRYEAGIAALRERLGVPCRGT